MEFGCEADWARGAPRLRPLRPEPRLREGGSCRDWGWGWGGWNWTLLNLWTGLSSWRLASLEIDKSLKHYPQYSIPYHYLHPID